MVWTRLSNFLFMPWSIRYIYIRSSNRIGSNTEIQSSNMFESDIRPSLEGQGFFEYIFGISENILHRIVMVRDLMKLLGNLWPFFTFYFYTIPIGCTIGLIYLHIYWCFSLDLLQILPYLYVHIDYLCIGMKHMTLVEFFEKSK